MSVTSLKEIADTGRGGSAKGNFAVEDTRVFRVVTNSSNDNMHTMLASGLFAAHGSGHPNNPWSTLREWKFRQALQNNGRIWYASADYSSQPETTEEKERRVQPNPLLRRAKVSLRFDRETYTRVKDKNGKPYTTSAGEKVVAPPKTRSNLVIEITKNLPGYPAFFVTHKDRINSSPIVIFTSLGPLPSFAAKTLKFNPLSVVDVQEEGGIPYVEARFEFLTSTNQFKTDVLNYGRWYKTSGGTLIKDGLEEQFLAADGKILGAGLDPTYSSYDDEDEADFSGIPIS